ncbi:hypothetical protein [Mycoplasmopsis felifaucium]|uniref:hypothetical protein n=1 Tax=Mycoplasmopsis felifaucium TaxID=35768 RepID=UPI00048083ED|nr:hypothetical protein [Mycoplasmopsis felifaucium]
MNFIFEYENSFKKFSAKYLEKSNIDNIKIINIFLEKSIEKLNKTKRNNFIYKNKGNSSFFSAKYSTSLYPNVKTINDFVSRKDWKEIKSSYTLNIKIVQKMFSFTHKFLNGFLDGSGMMDVWGALKESGGPPWSVVAGYAVEIIGSIFHHIDKELKWVSQKLEHIYKVALSFSFLDTPDSEKGIEYLFNNTNYIKKCIYDIDYGWDIFTEGLAKSFISNFHNKVSKKYFKANAEYQKFLNSNIISSPAGSWY